MQIQFLQEYWWCLVSLLGSLLVMLMFVQGGQSFIFQIAKGDENRKKLIANSLGRKWELTFTTLVTFGGAFFASFPKFYSVSFGGATYVWVALLMTMIIQAVAYEYRSKENNVLGTRTYDCFLTINGIVAPLLVGTAVGTFFFGSNFTFRPLYFTITNEQFSMVSWDSAWHGLEAVAEPRNLLLGFSVLFLARVLGLLYMINTIEDDELIKKARKSVLINSVVFLVFFLSFLACLLLATGIGEVYSTSSLDRMGTSLFIEKDYAYLNNFLSLPLILVLFLVGVVSVLVGMIKGAFTKCTCGFWYAAIGTVFVVFSLFIVAAWNGISYYPSLSDPNSSLTITNSSSSMTTLTIMTYVSFIIPFVLAYIIWAWRKMNAKKIDINEIEND